MDKTNKQTSYEINLNSMKMLDLPQFSNYYEVYQQIHHECKFKNKQVHTQEVFLRFNYDMKIKVSNIEGFRVDLINQYSLFR